MLRVRPALVVLCAALSVSLVASISVDVARNLPDGGGNSHLGASVETIVVDVPSTDNGGGRSTSSSRGSDNSHPPLDSNSPKQSRGSPIQNKDSDSAKAKIDKANAAKWAAKPTPPAPEGYLTAAPQQLFKDLDYKKAASVPKRDCAPGDKVCLESNRFMRRLYSQQFPTDCGEGRKYMLCYPFRPYGFASMFHHVAWCMTVGYALGRTVIIKSLPHNFINAPDCKNPSLKDAWECYFQPVTHCVEPTKPDHPGQPLKEKWTPGKSERSNAKILYIEYDSIRGHPDDFVYWTDGPLQRSLKDSVDVRAWVKGQLVWFLFRPNPDIQKYVDDVKAKIGFQTPIAGLHIRRTDKIVQKEAKAISTANYFEELQRFYDKNPAAAAAPEKRVFLATDEEKVIEEARRMYPQYKFIVRPSAAKNAADVDSRGKYQGMVDTITDIALLADCDFVVATFSSNIGRFVFELAQYYKNGKAKDLVKSLDKEWYYEF